MFNATEPAAAAVYMHAGEYQPLLCDVALLEFVVQLLQLGLQLRVRLGHGVSFLRRRSQVERMLLGYAVAIRDMLKVKIRGAVSQCEGVRQKARVKNGQKGVPDWNRPCRRVPGSAHWLQTSQVRRPPPDIQYDVPTPEQPRLPLGAQCLPHWPP